MNIRTISIADVDITKLPKFIYNRFDLWTNSNYLIFEADILNEYLEVLIKENHAIIGSWKKEVNSKVFKYISAYMFKHYPNIEYVEGDYNIAKVNPCYERNHYFVSLPKNIEELFLRLNSHHRGNYKRSIKQLENTFGKLSFEKKDINNLDKNVFEFYFENKEKMTGTNYNLSYKEYIDKYHVTHAYLLYFGYHLSSIVFSCEQTQIPYIENLTFDYNMKKYSVGIIAYSLYLIELGKNGYELLYLGGGNYSYKERFGGVCEKTYKTYRYRNICKQFYETLKSYRRSFLAMVNKKK